MQQLVKTLSGRLGLTGQEIAEAIWLVLQTGERVIDVEATPVDSLAHPLESGADAGTMPQPPVKSGEAEDTSDAEQTADLVPAPPTPSLELPPNYTPIPVPDAPSIAQSLQLARTLRPLARRVAVGLAMEIDESATVDQVAESGVYQLVLKPASELWLNVALVFDTSSSMCLWQRLGADLHRLLSRYGEFRDVRIWKLQHEAADRVCLMSLNGVSHKPRELLTGDRRCLVVVVSDCVAPAWHNGAMRDLIGVWTETLPTVVFHVFPERLWSRTALARSVTVEFCSRRAGVASNQLRPVVRSYWDQKRLTQQMLQGTAPRLPVVSIEPEALSNWAKVVAGDRRARVLGIVWDAQPVDTAALKFSSSPSSSDTAIKEQVDSFLLTASPTARHLASLVAAAPVVTLPIVRLIRQSMLRHASAVHIAEVFMSGLLKVSGAKSPTFKNAENIAYELIDDEVRDRLGAGALVVDTITVLTQVSRYIAQGLGRSMSEFKALLRTPGLGQSEPETEFLNAFATVTAKILQGLGSDYDGLSQRLGFPGREILEPSRELAQFPDLPLERFEYESIKIIALPSELTRITTTVTQYVQSTESFRVKHLERVRFVEDTPDEDQSSESLETFSIRVATVEQQNSEWVVRYEDAEAQRYIEILPDGIPLELIAIPSGQFVMGSPDDEPERYDDESPQHEVVISYGFFMGRYPVTQSQWRVVESLPQVNQELNPDPSIFKGNDRPVENINWHEAVEFCDRLNHYFDSRTPDFRNYEYRLPTEAEWEYACRAGTTTPFHFGSMITTEVANYDGSSTYADGPSGESPSETTPVTQFNHANRFGLSDMHGNVDEWCLDHWHENYGGAPSDGRPWEEDPLHNNGRVFRGGSWLNLPWSCRSAFRDHYTPDDLDGILGFRVVLAPR